MNAIRKFFSTGRGTTTQPSKMSFLQPPGQTQPTTKPRAQVALAPRHGLMDWIRKMNNTPNISGTEGKLLNVTEEELAKHNKKTDCWTAISGNVYNITPYLDYHPGGVDEIMKGAGIDATVLFQEIHSWVNFASMLEKCLVGRLISKSGPKATSATTVKKTIPSRLRFDFRQPEGKILRLFVYTNSLTLTKEHVFLHLEQSKLLTIYVYIDGFVHTIALDLLELVTDVFDVRISMSNRSQIEIDLIKQVEQTWKSIGKFRSNNLAVCSMAEFTPLYFSATLIKRSTVTHDTDWYTFSLPSNVFMVPPIGYHVRLRRMEEDLSVVKPYTVVKKLVDDGDVSSEQTIQLLIKHYPDRAMTPLLKQLNIGQTIDMSACEGTFDLTRVERSTTVILLAAGTGLTPMIRILNYLSQHDLNEHPKKVFLLFFNKTQEDILCRDELQILTNQHKFVVHHVLSRPDSQWTGEKGYIRKDLIQRLLPPLPKTNESYQTLACICGPTAFTKLTVDLLNEQGYNENHFHVFLS